MSGPLDEATLVAKWNREHGMHLSREERSARRRDLGQGAPLIPYTPPQLRTNLPVAEHRSPQAPPVLVEGDRMRTATGSTSETRLTDLLARLADADAIGASRIRAWDRLQERRSA